MNEVMEIKLVKFTLFEGEVRERKILKKLLLESLGNFLLRNDALPHSYITRSHA